MQTDYNGSYTYGTTIVIPQCPDNVPNPFIIFLNPSDGTFNLNYEGQQADILAIDIFNSQGQNVYSSSDFQSAFDLSNNIPGMYVIRIKQDAKTINLKLVLTAD